MNKKTTINCELEPMLESIFCPWRTKADDIQKGTDFYKLEDYFMNNTYREIFKSAMKSGISMEEFEKIAADIILKYKTLEEQKSQNQNGDVQ